MPSTWAALADPHRRVMLELLRESPRAVGELDAVVADLPGAVARPRERHPALWMRPLPMFFALVLLAPVLFSVLLAAAVVMATLFSTWIVVVIVGWWLFGHRYRYRGPRGPGRHPMHPYGRWPTGRPGGPRPRPWV